METNYDELILTLHEDLEDEAANRKQQFDSISRNVAELDDRISYRLERLLVMCTISLSLGGVALCLAVGSMIFAL